MGRLRLVTEQNRNETMYLFPSDITHLTSEFNLVLYFKADIVFNMFMRIFRMFSPLLYILYIVRHSILRDGSGPGRLNRHRQEILTF